VNWEFHSVHKTDSKELVKEFSEYAAESVERWIYTLSLTALKEKQPEADMAEFPPGFYHDGASYNYRFRVYGPGGCLSPAEYDVTVKQTFYLVYTPPTSKEISRCIRYIGKSGRVC